MRYPSFIAMVFLVFARSVFAQTSMNPDISVIPRFLLETNDGTKFPATRKFSQPDFSFQELEIAISSYLNPYAKADVVLTLPGPDLEEGKLGLEELYATVLRGLPLDINLRLGKYRVDFGKLNLQHPHAWSSITQPLSQERFLGEEGLNDLGLSASVLLPTGDVYSKLTVDILRGAAIGEASGIEDTSGNKPTYATSGRLMGFFTLGDYTDLETGISLYTGIHDPYNRDRFLYLNYDFKFKYKPSAYTALVLQGEFLYNMRTASQDRDLNQFVDVNGNPEREDVHTAGLYFFADHQFFKIFSVGGRFDWSQSPYSKDDEVRAVAVFFGYYPVEETLGLRLQYQNRTDELPGFSQSVNSIGLQVLFSLGPHKAHPF
ncbi:MAG: hypothetical protein ACKVRP_04385 [Bacteroidota bacterium]